ncbi:MAG: iron uptake system protein EfeO, partial [Frankiaceae bacterium]
CRPEPATITAGGTTFHVTNSGAAAVSELEVLQGDRVLAEKENLAPGLSGSFSVALDPGEYTLYCPGAATEKTTLTVVAASSAPGPPSTSAALDKLDKLDKAVADYQSYVNQQAAQLVSATRGFAGAVAAGDVAKAKALFGPTRAYYERIEPVAESFGDLDPDIDARENDVADPAQWEGFHRIEKALWVSGSTAGMGPVANKLVSNVEKLQTLVTTARDQPAQLANGASELLDEVGKSKVTGEEDRYSHTDLFDFAANVEGAQTAYQLLAPELRTKDPALAATIETRFTDVTTALAAYRIGTGYVDYSTVGQAQRRVLAQKVDALAEPLSHVSALVVA